MLWVLGEAILTSTHNIGFYEDLTKIFLNYQHISSNTNLISSAAWVIMVGHDRH